MFSDVSADKVKCGNRKEAVFSYLPGIKFKTGFRRKQNRE